jgi:prepilin-type N-terminal cleavage/methylation domain-containing protein
MDHPRRRPDSLIRQAFTLVEVLVVVVILGIAAAMLVPRLTGMGDLQAMSAARALVANMQYAQNEAIVTQAPTTVAFDAGAGSYVLLDTAGVPLRHPVNKGDFRVRFSATRGLEKVEVISAEFGGGNSVTFDSLGSPDRGGQVVVGADGHTYTISVAPVTGKIDVAAN